MLNKTLPALYKRLRLKSGLSRKQYAALVEVSTNTLGNYESGRTRPDPKTEAKLLAASRCSALEVAETWCAVLSEELDMRVGIIDGERGYRPATSVAKAQHVRNYYGSDLPEPRLRALDNKVHTAELTRILYERHNADLDDYAADCRAEAEQRRRSTADPLTSDPLTSDPLTQGATGPANRGTSHRG